MNKIKAQINEKNIEMESLKVKNRKLQDEVNMSKSDAYIEKLAREKLKLIKPGESPVVNSN
jgi:cell division protein FtsB